MGNTESVPVASKEHEHSSGYRVINVHSGSPCDQARLEVFFDFIVKANEVLLDRESDAFMAIIRSSQEQQLRLTVYSVKTNSTRDVTITPSNNWGGANKPPGTLGATIRFDHVQSPDEHAWHVLDIHSNSPAALAGLHAHVDYILSAVDLIFKDEGDLEYVISRMVNKPVEFYVYSVSTDSVREVSITPNPSWGGDGMLGCDIGRGILHRLPFQKGRDQARMAKAQEEQSIEAFRQHATVTPTDGEMPAGRTATALDAADGTADESRAHTGAAHSASATAAPAPNNGSQVPAAVASKPQAPRIVTAVASAIPVDTMPAGLRTVVPVTCRSGPGGGGNATGVAGALTAIQRRAAAAVVGGFVADAATAGLHWIYDMAELQQRLATSVSGSPEFHEPPACPYYDYPSGSLSPYGDEALVLLRCMCASDNGEAGGELEPVEFAGALFEWAKEYREGGGFIDHATQGFLTNMLAGQGWPQCGAEDKQANCLGKVAMVVARYAGTGELANKVTEAVRVHQNHDQAVSFAVAAALLLEQVVLGSSLPAALELSKASMDAGALAAVEAAEAAGALSTADMLGGLGHQLMPGESKAALVGRSCGFPQAFSGSVHAILGARGDYARGVRANILAGGDNCCRAGLVGAVLAALAVDDGSASVADVVPAAWRERTGCAVEVEALALALASCNAPVLHPE
jgi:hypothetical protein|eukprot:COSAG06_NODE_1447_length_9439_cov_4.457602_4_plen_688_part_00